MNGIISLFIMAVIRGDWSAASTWNDILTNWDEY